MTSEPTDLGDERTARRLAELDALLRSDPRLRARYHAAVAGVLSCPALEVPLTGPGPDMPVSLRIPASLLEAADALIPVLGEDPEIRAILGGPPPRAAVLRLALVAGLDALRRRYAADSSPGSPG